MSKEFTYSIGAFEEGQEVQKFLSNGTYPDIDRAKRQAGVDIMASQRGWELFLPWRKMKTSGTIGWWYNDPINIPKTLTMVIIAHPASATEEEINAVIDEFLAERR
ncbi:hypothetical protein MUG78_18010 [Gordonia alkaliphila]|uniref:hypothetical protein n=1 Tax=Gordonia alkaliphila TaxID=1053547 RepID=UPI001FF6B9CD|nr:hypothetical protein [Gordonia alkaliphila]MCK0441296.1 hypothetical protein [Gordonia alkaliphila]